MSYFPSCSYSKKIKKSNYICLTMQQNLTLKRYIYNAKINNMEDKIPDIINLSSTTITNASLNAKLPMLLLMLK